MEYTNCALTAEFAEASHGAGYEADGEFTGLRSSGELGFGDLGIGITEGRIGLRTYSFGGACGETFVVCLFPFALRVFLDICGIVWFKRG